MTQNNEQIAKSHGKEILQAYLDGKENPSAPHGFCNCSNHERLMIKFWLLGQHDSNNKES